MSRIKDFFDGTGHLMRGFGFLASRPKLWPWAILPTLINFLLLVAMIVVLIHYFGDIHAWLSGVVGSLDIENPTAWYWHIVDGIFWVLNLLLKLLIFIVGLIISLVVAYGLSFVVAGPFNDILSERVEIMVTGIEPPPFTLKRFVWEIARTIRVETVKAIILIAIPAVLFILNIIPVVGGILYIVLTCMFGAWDMGFSYAELPLGRRAASFKERVAFGRAHRWALMGLGIGFIIPFFALLFAAPMAVGGTLLYLDRKGKG